MVDWIVNRRVKPSLNICEHKDNFKTILDVVHWIPSQTVKLGMILSERLKIIIIIILQETPWMKKQIWNSWNLKHWHSQITRYTATCTSVNKSMVNTSSIRITSIPLIYRSWIYRPLPVTMLRSKIHIAEYNQLDSPFKWLWHDLMYTYKIVFNLHSEMIRSHLLTLCIQLERGHPYKQ